MNDKSRKLLSEFPPVSKKDWKDLIIKDLKGGDYNKKMLWKTPEGIEIDPFFTSEDLEKIQYINAAPASFPYVRGNKEKDNAWEICQRIVVSDMPEANAKAKEFIAGGVTGIEFNLQFHCEQEDMNQLLEGIQLEKTALHFSGVHSYSILLELLKDFCENNNIDRKKVRGSFNFDSFAYYLTHGEYYNSCTDNLSELKCLFTETAKAFPHIHILNINGNLYANAGASVAQELAFSVSSAHEYLVKMLEMNLKAEDVLPHVKFTFATGSSFFLEIAKIRVARILWGIIAGNYVPGREHLAQTTIQSISSTENKAIFDSHNNILRTTTETMSAIIGGSNIIHTLPFDDTWKPSDSFSERIARNIQHILREESYLDKVIDPSAGSYYIEELTVSIAQKAWELFLEIENMGGYIQAMEKQYIKTSVEHTAVEKYNLIAARKKNILGVTLYPNLNERMADKISNPMPEVTGEKGLKPFRGAQAFEELRLATGNYIVNGGIRPKVYLAQYGNLAMRIARAQFITNFFGIAGFEIIEGEPINNIDWTINQIRELKADIVAICSSDTEYDEVAPELAKAVKKADKDTIVIIAGNPAELAEMLKQAGVDDFIHVKTNALESLKNYQLKIGIQQG